jgi:hypothetical protein
LAPNDFWLFLKIRSSLKRQRFQGIEAIQKNVKTVLKAVPQQELQKCFQQLQHCWAKCIAAEGAYFKGEPSE